jgi:hypothetical protein
MKNEVNKNRLFEPKGKYFSLYLEIEVEGEKGPELNATVFHEYTHYLQNMTTTNGFVSLDRYIHVLLKSFVKLGSDHEDPTIPLYKNHELQAFLGDHNVDTVFESRTFGMDYDYLNKKYLFESTDLDDYSITIKEHLSKYTGSLIKISYIALDGKNVPINETVIIENMAFMNTMIARIGTDVLNKSWLDKILSQEYKEYNAIFFFIHKYLTSCNLIKLVYSICEISLNMPFSENIIANILMSIQKDADKLSHLETDTIISLIKEGIDYENIQLKLLKINQETIYRQTKELFNGFDYSKNEFVFIISAFYDFLIKGLEYRISKKTLYINRLTNEYVQKLASIIGCPAIYFKELNEYQGLSETPEYFFSDFTYLYGALKIFTLLYYDDISMCPFYKGNVCKVRKNNSCKDNCLNNYDDNIYVNCLLSNVLKCTGIRQEHREKRES